MELSKNTLNVLKIFSKINQSLMFREGNILSTVSPQKTVLANVQVDENFSFDFGIYNLEQFLTAIDGLSENRGLVSLDFKEDHLVMNADVGSIIYRYADPGCIVTPPKKGIVLSDIDGKFELTQIELKRLMKMAERLGLPDIIFASDGEQVTATAGDAVNSSMNSFNIPLTGLQSEGNKFKHHIKIGNMKMMLLDYTVSISTKGISKFEGERSTYFIATETHR